MKLKYTLFGVFLAIGFTIAYAQEVAVDEPVIEVPQVENRPQDLVFASTTFSSQMEREVAVREYVYQQEILRRLDQINFYLKQLNDR